MTVALKRFFEEHPDLKDEGMTVDRFVGGVTGQSKAGIRPSATSFSSISLKRKLLDNMLYSPNFSKFYS